MYFPSKFYSYHFAQLIITACVYQEDVRPWPYMHRQPNLSPTMRAILIDWLVEVHMKFRLVPEVLYLSVNIIDRYLQKVEVQRSKLQLVGVTALLIASKYEEIYPPEVRDCVYITNRAYTRQEVIDMEVSILKVINFKLSGPTAYPFLQRFLFITRATPTMAFAAAYYLERVLQEHDILKFRPSLVAASAVCLALNHPEIRMVDKLSEKGPKIVSTSLFSFTGLPFWYLLTFSFQLKSPILLEYSNFSEEMIIKCARVICSKAAEEVVTVSKRELVAVKRKYSDKRYSNVGALFGQPREDHLL
jgi:hypothetical protein